MHWWRGEDRQGFYVDTARSIDVRRDTVSYVDLYLDLSYDKGAWSLLDEEELSLASPADAELARRAIDEVRTLVARGDPLFDPDGDPWALPAEVSALGRDMWESSCSWCSSIALSHSRPPRCRLSAPPAGGASAGPGNARSRGLS